MKKLKDLTRGDVIDGVVAMVRKMGLCGGSGAGYSFYEAIYKEIEKGIKYNESINNYGKKTAKQLNKEIEKEMYEFEKENHSN